MLILTRLPDESIMIGDDVEVVVLSVKGDLVKLGINAPKSIGVHRWEVYAKLQEENEDDQR